jgi:hypothetical protein
MAGVYDPGFRIYEPLLKNTSHFTDFYARFRKYDSLSPKYMQLVEKSISCIGFNSVQPPFQISPPYAARASKAKEHFSKEAKRPLPLFYLSSSGG